MYSKVLDSVLVAKEAMELISQMIYSESCNHSLLAQRLNELKRFLMQLKQTVVGAKTLFPENRIDPITNNLVHYLEAAGECALQGQADELQSLYHYYLYTLFRVMMSEYAACCAPKIDKEKHPEFYAEPVFNKEKVRSDENRLCKVSIVLLAYNHIDYTKKALNSILKYTDDVEYELILVNNGSTDETESYFNSIQGAIPIHLKENISVSPGFNTGIFAARGKYIACVCNDFIFSHNWLKNLLICIESDENIGFVSPVSSYISNCQQVDLPFANDKQLHQQAKKYNVSDPSKWEKRTRLLPNVLMCPADLLQGLNGYAQEYIYGEFADDDISYRIYRAGFEQVLCCDTWAHHFGHITSGKAQVENNSLGVSRQIFKDKWGFDAWENFIPDYQFAQSCAVTPAQVKGRHIRMLAVDAKIGGTALSLKNKMMSCGAISVDIYHITTDKRFLSNHNVVYFKECLVDDFSSFESLYDGVLFDFVLLAQDLTDSEFDCSFFAKIKKQINGNGSIFFSLKNAGYLGNVMDIICQRIGSPDSPMTKIVGVQNLCHKLEELGFSNSVLSLCNASSQNSAQMFAKAIQASPDVAKYLAIERYIISSQSH